MTPIEFEISSNIEASNLQNQSWWLARAGLNQEVSSLISLPENFFTSFTLKCIGIFYQTKCYFNKRNVYWAGISGSVRLYKKPQVSNLRKRHEFREWRSVTLTVNKPGGTLHLLRYRDMIGKLLCQGCSQVYKRLFFFFFRKRNTSYHFCRFPPKRRR